MNNESAPEEKEAIGRLPSPLLKTLKDMLHNRIEKKKVEIHRTQNRGDITDRVWTEIDTDIVLGTIAVLVSEGSSRSDSITNN